MKAMVSLCITSYNRRDKLKNCIESFFMTNQYPLDKIQVVIVDNGSDDKKTIEYIKSLNLNCNSTKVVYNEKNDYPFCLRRAKNQARLAADGEYFIDCPDDHLFVTSSRWIESCIEYLKIEKEKISCICHYSYPAYRFLKSNNKMSESEKNIDYHVSHLKGYADYHLMSRNAYSDIGNYREDLSFTPNAESEYMDRSYSMGYRRALMKFPSSIINENCFRLIRPVDIDTLRNIFSHYTRPIDNESITAYLIQAGYIE